MNMNTIKAELPVSGGRHWLRRFGLAGFSFFLIKGMLWLLIPWLAHSALF